MREGGRGSRSLGSELGPRASEAETGAAAVAQGDAVILLDTHTWFWLGTRPDRLSAPARAAIDRALKSGGLAIAPVSLLEMAWLMAHHRLGFRGTSGRAFAGRVWR